LTSFFITEKRKAWIYEVPLASVHHLRESLNGVGPDQPIPKELLAKYDAPVIASAVKLWVLELDPPLTLWEGWDEIRKLYPSGMFSFNVTDNGLYSLGALFSRFQGQPQYCWPSL
jgi:hypothetical protein